LKCMIVDDPMLLEKEDEPIGLLVVRSKQVFVCKHHRNLNCWFS